MLRKREVYMYDWRLLCNPQTNTEVCVSQVKSPANYRNFQDDCPKLIVPITNLKKDISRNIAKKHIDYFKSLQTIPESLFFEVDTLLAR